MIHFTLYSRSYCHLCDDMLEALQAMKKAYLFTIDVVDVDADDALVAQYDELVPVLVANNATGTTTRLCHYFLNKETVEKYLQNTIVS